MDTIKMLVNDIIECSEKPNVNKQPEGYFLSWNHYDCGEIDQYDIPIEEGCCVEWSRNISKGYPSIAGLAEYKIVLCDHKDKGIAGIPKKGGGYNRVCAGCKSVEVL